jgi:hypothetical protein
MISTAIACVISMTLLLITVPDMSAAFRPSNSIMQRKVTSNIGNISPLHAWKFDGPGETKAVPKSSSTRSQLDTAKLVITAAIFYMTLQLKIEEALAFMSVKSKSESSELPRGINYRDISIGSGQVLADGDDFELECKIFYNGIELPDSRCMLSSDGNRDFKYPIGIIKEGMKGIRLGGRRNLVVRASDALLLQSDMNLDIPRDSNIIFDIRLLSVTTRAIG